MKRTHHVLHILLAVAASTAVVSCKKAAGAGAVAQETPRPAARVETASVVSRDAPTWLLLTGQLKGAHETNLAANVAGRIVSTKVERGSVVKAGDVIATVDVRAASLSAAEAKAHAASALAQADIAKIECGRAKSLVASGAISNAELDRVEAQCKSSELTAAATQARSELAAKNVGDGVIRAPFAGAISERFVDVGAFVHMDTKVVTMVDLSELRLELTVPETSIEHAKPGAKVRFSVPGYRDRAFDGEVRYVAASVRQATRDVVAEAVVHDPDGVLRSGMFASVRLAQGSVKAPSIPKSALVVRDGKDTVFVVVDKKVEQRIVQVGDEVGDGLVATLRGVAEGERVVVSPPPDLTNNQSVE
ncbi:MAG: efflux RND transporter periplasmic adaptor subunit [Labilithrix sp.]|nr:efflux RND transporter periplasmic adaptor subunit [Labilithrix sp.]MCW5832675.1 efflux RND transporter periplasmic adaptor subunit [Labilithrix sp.]